MNKLLKLLIALSLIWELGCRVLSIPVFVLPPLSMIIEAMWAGRFVLLKAILLTLTHAFSGLVLGNLVGIAGAIMFTYFKGVRDYGFLLATLVKLIPFVAIASILYIILGSSPILPALLVGMATFYPIVSNLDAGLNEVPGVLLDRMKILDASKWQTFKFVRWPNALPYYVAACRVSFTTAVIVSLVAEWLVGQGGLGYVILRAMSDFRLDQLWAATLTSLVMGAIVLLGVELMGKKFDYRQKR